MPDDTSTTTATAETAETKPEAKADEKTFTQADIDRIVQERVGREKARFGDYDDLKAKAAKLDELEQANRTELEKAVARAEAAEKKALDAEAAVRASAIRSAIIAEASKAGAADPADLIALIDPAALTVGEGNTVTGADKAVEKLLKDKPYLKKQTTANGGFDGGARGGGNGPSQLTRQDLQSMKPEEIVKARAEGRLRELMGG